MNFHRYKDTLAEMHKNMLEDFNQEQFIDSKEESLYYRLQLLELIHQTISLQISVQQISVQRMIADQNNSSGLKSDLDGELDYSNKSGSPFSMDHTPATRSEEELLGIKVKIMNIVEEELLGLKAKAMGIA